MKFIYRSIVFASSFGKACASLAVPRQILGLVCKCSRTKSNGSTKNNPTKCYYTPDFLRTYNFFFEDDLLCSRMMPMKGREAMFRLSEETGKANVEMANLEKRKDGKRKKKSEV